MTKSRFGASLVLTLTVFSSFAVLSAHAETAPAEAAPLHPALNDRFIFGLGAFYSRSSTQAGLSGSAGGVGATVDFEKVLGLDERNVSINGGFVWRMTERWRLEADYFSLNRDATRTLGSEVRWGDNVYPAGTQVDSSYNFRDTRVGVGYSFFKRQDKELGIGAGLHVAGIKASVHAAGAASEATDVLAPLPVLSLYGAFALTDRWAVRMRMDWLSLSYGPYAGDVRSMAFDLLYQPFRHVGFGLGQRSLSVDMSIDKPNWHGDARTTFQGPTAFMTVSF